MKNGPDWLTKLTFGHSQGLICIISVITRIAEKKFTDPHVAMETTLQQPWESLSLEFLRKSLALSGGSVCLLTSADTF